jgi:hypothetical protein
MPTVQNIINTVVATGVFKFLPGSALPSTPEQPTGYTFDFGEAEYTVKAGGDIKELWLASGGILGKSKKRTVKPTLTIERDLQYLSPDVLGYFSGTANTGGTPSFGKVVEGFGWFGLQMEGENIVPTGSSNAGSSIWTYHSFPCDVLISGEVSAKGDDFASVKLMVEAMLGRGRGTVVIGSRPITPVP